MILTWFIAQKFITPNAKTREDSESSRIRFNQAHLDG